MAAWQQQADICVIGSGMAGLAAASLAAREGHRVVVLEQNWQPGGCTGSYWRKGFVFETGATTLVGLDPDMPLRYLLEQTGVQPEAWQLELPMQVQLADGQVIRKYQPLDQWIAEAKRVFGPEGQEAFWRHCYQISQFVWQTSMQQTAFPPTRWSDLWALARHASLRQFRYAGYSFFSTEWLLRQHGLHRHQAFRRYVDEQLLITAQNHAPEVNVLFGATALCYTQYGNYYVPGGLQQLVQPFVRYIEGQGSQVLCRRRVEAILRQGDGYLIRTPKGEVSARRVIAAIPLNNTLSIFQGPVHRRFGQGQMDSPQLNSAFQVGIGFRPVRQYDCLHHQLHLSTPLPGLSSGSIFVSLSHPADTSRADESGCMVASVSTHVQDPAARRQLDHAAIEAAIIRRMEEANLLKSSEIRYIHSSGPGAWEKWTGRRWGFVGGYPQYMSVKPWQMLDARLDGHGAYLCGDTTYPGQGIPGATLSGIIAWQKLKRDAGW